MEETGAVSDRAPPCGIQPTSSCKSARSHREDVSGLTLDLRHSLQAVVGVPLGFWPACSLIRCEAAEDTSGSARKRGQRVKDCHVSYMQTGKSCRL